MNAIDQFIDFIATLYTPKRALATLFMLIGCILTLYMILPYLNQLLEPALRSLTEDYKNYIIIIALCSGITAGIVFFNFLSGCWSAVTGFFNRRREMMRTNRQACEAAQIKHTKLVDDFKTAHAHLSNGKLSILRQLLTVPTQNYLTACPDIAFMERAGWILPLAASSNDENVYKINPVIQPVANKLWNEEVENNTYKFISSEQNINQFIIAAFTDVNSPTAIARAQFALSERYIKSCFDLQTITASCYNLKFKRRYQQKFEELINRELCSQRMFTLNDDSETGSA